MKTEVALELQLKWEMVTRCIDPTKEQKTAIGHQRMFNTAREYRRRASADQFYIKLIFARDINIRNLQKY